MSERFLRSEPEGRIRAIDLVNYLPGVRHGRAIAEAVSDTVHEVRVYRKALVHERFDPAIPVGLVEARRRLNTFPGQTAQKWG